MPAKTVNKIILYQLFPEVGKRYSRDNLVNESFKELINAKNATPVTTNFNPGDAKRFR